MNEFIIVLLTICGIIGFSIMAMKYPIKINKDRFVVSLLTLAIMLVGWSYAVIFKIISSNSF